MLDGSDCSDGAREFWGVLRYCTKFCYFYMTGIV